MVAYYNEPDPFASEWLKILCREGLICDGEVDSRDIQDVDPKDLMGFDQVHLFAGIGTWSYSLRLAGWPDDRKVWTASLPCQPFSIAGQRLECDDPRHLYPYAYNLIKECRPPVLLGEQVATTASYKWFDSIQISLEHIDFASGLAVFPACGLAGSPHMRQRLYWFAEDATSELELSRGDGRTSRSSLDHDGYDGQGTSDIENDGNSIRDDPGHPISTIEMAEPNGMAESNMWGIIDECGERLLEGGQSTDSTVPSQNSGTQHNGTSLDDGMAEPGNPRLQGHGQVPVHDELNGSEKRKTETRQYTEDRSSDGMAESLRMAEPNSPSYGSGKHGDQSSRNSLVERDGNSGRLNSLGSSADRSTKTNTENDGRSDRRPGPCNGRYDPCDWVYCRDGNWRPIEPGTEPLVNGSSERVGRLRGYGNSIVVGQAVAFIESFIYAQKQLETEKSYG